MKKVNEWLAVQITQWFSTMACFYVCVVYSLAAALPHLAKFQPQMLYWSNAVQLSALPVLGLGQIVLSRAAERRAEEDHTAIMEELQELKQLRADMNALLKMAAITKV